MSISGVPAGTPLERAGEPLSYVPNWVTRSSNEDRLLKILAPMKNAISFFSAGYGCLLVLGVGLVGTGSSETIEILVKAVLVSIAAGLVLAALPPTASRPVLIFAAFPTGLLSALLLLGFVENLEVKNLVWLSFPVGIFLAIVSPSVIRNQVRKSKID